MADLGEARERLEGALSRQTVIAGVGLAFVNAADISTVLAALPQEGVSLGFEEPEIEEDEDGTVTVRAFSADRQRLVSFHICADHVRKTTTPGESVRLERSQLVWGGDSSLRPSASQPASAQSRTLDEPASPAEAAQATDLTRLVPELREASMGAQRVAWSRTDGGQEYCLQSILADKAADAIEGQADKIEVLEAALLSIAEKAGQLAVDRETAQPAIPAGWVLVPREPTEAMLSHVAGCDYRGLSAAKQAAELAAYCAMLAASPLPPVTPAAEWRPTHRHVKRGSLYRLTGQAVLQTEAPVADDAHLLIYQDARGLLWARPSAEFNDGRFEPIPAAPAHQHEGGER